MKGMIRSHNLLHAPKKAKRDVLYLGLRLAGKYDSMQGLVMKPDANEACGNYCLLLGKLYSELSPRFSLTFGAGESWKELLI